MPKKGKKPKLPLTDEEQLILFQQKLLADEEAAKKKERLLTQFLKVMLGCSVLPRPCASDVRCLGLCDCDRVIFILPFPLKSLVPKYMGFRQPWFLPRAFFVNHGEEELSFAVSTAPPDLGQWMLSGVQI